ncbi:MAG: thioredoxin domain-containing protein, partial [Verrucomicrobiota bacterium]
MGVADEGKGHGSPFGNLPGAGQTDPDLLRRFAAARDRRGAEYRPRTRHLRADGWAKYTNRLFLETSPYLLQHAHNPVDWYPWGDEAFERAGKLGRPVFVSIGYSTCHWCHVMEEESFEDEATARLLNERFVAVKVDREERPDVDAIYLKAVQGLTGRGGWPLNVWLTPDRRPFYGGTYFPPTDDAFAGAVAFPRVLEELARAYASRPAELAEVARNVTEFVRESLCPKGGTELPSAGDMASAARFYRDHFDRVNGGLSGAPKFPSQLPVRFLLRYHRRTGDGAFLSMAALTLRAMAAGGIHDQVGGGFHRYATDERWLVPHFEKMLYDNALLAVAYLEGYQATGEEEFARIARDTLRFLERDMASPEGAFSSATDADSPDANGRRAEGHFFTWTPAELEAALGPETARIVGSYFGVTREGTFEGRSILHAPADPSAVARSLDISEEQLLAAVRGAAEVLCEARSRRPPPFRDEKIITAWNGLTISAFARAALTLGDSGYAGRASRTARFLLDRAFHEGRLYRVVADRERRHPACLDDYAFLVAGLLDLYEASSETHWLERAVALDRILERRFEDRDGGGCFLTAEDGETLPVREKPSYDGAEPSGNSVTALNLLRLHEFTTDTRFRERAERAFRAMAPILRTNPVSLSEMLLAVDFHLDTPRQILIVVPAGAVVEEAEPLLSAVRRRFLPNRTLCVARAGEHQKEAAQFAP